MLKTLLSLIFTLLCFLANAQDTTYSFHLGTYKYERNIHPELYAKYADFKPFANSFKEEAKIYAIEDTLEFVVNKKKQHIVVKHYFYNKLKSVDEAMVIMQTDSIFNAYFSDATLKKVYHEGNQMLMKNIDQQKLDDFAKPAVGFLYNILFFDPFKTLGANTIITDDEGEVVLTKKGNAAEREIPMIVIWLVIGALFFTIYMRFINIRGFKHAIQLVSGKYDDPNTHGEVSHFQALATALSATVGLGNIAGVAIAISVGGPGATFWMIIAGLLGMSSKFVECTLGVKYRQIKKDGEVSGGPMYYLREGLKKKGLGDLGKVLAMMFAIFCILASFGGGNMFQSNQAFSQIESLFPLLSGNGVIVGSVLALLVGIVIIGGIKGIARVTEKIVPVMAVLYVGTALIIVLINISQFGDAMAIIWNGAFSPDAAKGGIIGVLILGFRRAAFSNEAGVGSASIAHSAVKTEKPVTEGIVSLLEPFIDTVVICTMTALVIIFTGQYDNPYGLQGAPLTSSAFASVFSWFPYLLAVAIILFAFSTMISWSYYGLKAWTFIFGEGKRSAFTYRVIFLLFVVAGASLKLGAVIDFSDMMLLAMAFPNILGMYILSPEVLKDTQAYFKSLRK